MREIIDVFKTLTKSSNKIIKLMDTYDKTRQNPVDNAYLLEKKVGELEKMIPELPEFELKNVLSAWLKKEKIEIEGFKEDFRMKFGQQLNKYLSKTGKKIKGQYPVLRIGFYTLKMDFQFGEATLFFGPEIEKIKSKIPLEPKTIFETIEKYDKELRSIKSKSEDLLKNLSEAYNRRLKLSNKASGEKLLITEVLNEFVLLKQSKRFLLDPQKAHFHEYSRVKLSYLLYYLKNSGLFEKGVRLHVATFDATTDKMTSIWIPENEEGEGTHYSHISFEGHI